MIHLDVDYLLDILTSYYMNKYVDVVTFYPSSCYGCEHSLVFLLVPFLMAQSMVIIQTCRKHSGFSLLADRLADIIRIDYL